MAYRGNYYSKRRLEGKYIFRRIILIAVPVLIIAAGAYFFLKKPFDEKSLTEEPVTSNDALQTLAAASQEDTFRDIHPESEEDSFQELAIKPEESQAEASEESEPEDVESSSEAESKVDAIVPDVSGATEPWKLLLVNQRNLLPEGYVPELETITGKYQVDARIAGNVRRMFEQAQAEGVSLMICSAYRSVDYQKTLFANKKQEYINYGRSEEDAIAVAATIVAVPGTSEHHTGLAMDIVTPSYQSLDDGFENTDAFRWLDKNAYKYGFILRFPKDKQNITGIIYEPWHYRYVGETDAAIIKEQGVCLEEYIAQRQASQPANKSASSKDEQSETKDDGTDVSK